MDEKKLLRGFFHRPSRTFAGFAAQQKWAVCAGILFK
jgi:hypothetical protein